MTTETIKKRDELISHFGSIDNYQLAIFDKIPPLFLMVCDADGNVDIDRESVSRYIEKEMKEHSITIEQLIERDKKKFAKAVDELYLEVFN